MRFVSPAPWPLIKSWRPFNEISAINGLPITTVPGSAVSMMSWLWSVVTVNGVTAWAKFAKPKNAKLVPTNSNESDLPISDSYNPGKTALMENEVLPQNDESAVTMMQIVIVQA